MKLNFKDLKQQKFSIDAEPSETIEDLKKKVGESQSLDATLLRLIWSGKILKDEDKIEAYDIKPTDLIVCMVQKPKQPPAAAAIPKALSTPAQAPAAQTPAAPAPAPAVSITTTTPAAAPSTPSPAPAAQSQRSFNEPGSLMVGTERQAAIQHMEGMGFARPDIERAMRAAFNNPDRAVEYLLNGIPESALQQAGPQRPAGQPQSPPPQPAAPQAPTGAAAATETATRGSYGDEPINLFEAAAAQQGGRAAGTPRAAAGAGTTGTAAGTGGQGGGRNLEFLRENQTFQHLRQLIQEQPQMLESILTQLAASNPQLAQQINANPHEFMQMLAESQDGDVPLPPGAQQVAVTPDERDAIERLCRLGFERDLVIQAYFACDKDEELAANFLFDHPEEEQGGEQ